ncbi:MAG TPA: DUF2807 domain-containing protein [Mucilaginibacter sp.]|nr:DUF2807 domain-containing protein [Mucilaginibacter sp.]
MKPSILTLAIALSVLLGASQAASAATYDKEAVTTLSQVGQISKIEVHGNVELYVSYGQTDQVKVYNNYYAESAMVQGQDGVLRIASYKDQKLVVWVSAANLQKLSVYDNAVVKSFGKLSALELNVNLYDHASAQLNLDVYAVNVKLNGHAKADVSGSAYNANLSGDHSSTLNYALLDSEHLVKKTNTGYLNADDSLVAIQ